MDRYADRPMDLADATLVAMAEERGDRRIFTLDADFQIYRFRGRPRFETIPIATAEPRSSHYSQGPRSLAKRSVVVRGTRIR